MRPSLFFFAATLLSLVVPLKAQAPAAPATPKASPAAVKKNLIGNPGFETGFRHDNLWDGVNTEGALSVERGSALPILTVSGTIADTSMPVSVSVADMNGDGLTDIATMDVLGYLRIFFNSGTKTAPKFTIGELSTLFLSRVNITDTTLQGLEAEHIRQGQRIRLTAGKKDLFVGNYLGEIMFIPNAGSGVRPDFRQPPSISPVLIPTMKDPVKKWGNLFAPAVWDWNRDGKDDLLVGEGSYSANNIHLLLNQGSAARPVFDENNRSVLACGMGLEQLTPAVVDYNGDGHPDLLVAERTGKVAVYLNNGAAWKPGDLLAFDSFISTTGAAAPATKDPMDAEKTPGLLSVGGVTTVDTADMNGDGLFDLIFGKSSGKILMSLNTGTKTAPKFGVPVELKGDAGTPAFNSPSGWTCDNGLTRGNFYSFFSVVKEADDPTAAPSEGKACLKAGYIPSPNKTLPVPNQYTPAFSDYKFGDNMASFNAIRKAPASAFSIFQDGRFPLKHGKTYVFSMRVKGVRVTDALARISYNAKKELAPEKIERGDRNSAKVIENTVLENKDEIFKFLPGATWSDVKKEFTVKFANKELQDEKQQVLWSVGFLFTLAPGAGVMYIDDVKLIEK